ncbi:thiol reductant ABC exporter subunit CydD [Methylobrevis pamukkalensis]|uniref:ATP-binding/permease protein CydD n=1 Tax=Methylobrevis pamukkalensis TaxID=1439726 RepID=A0A1E3H6G8_9HYPH|nr:thiol reductant ABC exporter subunit CydD [Methylobrevis pamukkalensis]ODN71913.1 ATP-binding/permease protein CydD [Methylobrevis pamukkalensis]
MARTKTSSAAALSAHAPVSRRAAVLSVGAALLWLPQAWLLALGLGNVVAGNADHLPSLIGGFLVLALLRAGLDGASHMAASRHAAAIKLRLRERLAEQVARWSPADTGRPKTGEIVALAGAEIESLDPWLTRYAPTKARMTFLPIAILVATLPFSWAAGLLLALAGPIIPVLMSLIGAAARERSAEQLAEVGSLTGTLLDRLAGLATIRLFGATERTADAIEAAGDRIRTRTMSVLRLAFLSSAVLELFSAIGVGLIAVYIGFSLLGWIDFGATAAPLTLQTGLFLLFIAPDFFQPLRDFAAAYHDKAAAEAAAARYAALVETPRAQMVGAGAAGAPRSRGPLSVNVRGLTVDAPDGGRRMLAATDLVVAPGERVAIVGPSGSGKTTLLHAIAGLIAPTTGEVTVGGQPLGDATAADLRRRMAWIGQSPHLLHGTLRANLAFVAPAVDAAAMDAALRLATCDFAECLPRGLATPVGETGAGLSGGEGRRIAVARAALAPADLVLADEPTASLDAETAAAVRRGLLALSEGRTLIVATHDEALAAAMDRIIRIGDTTGSGTEAASIAGAPA